MEDALESRIELGKRALAEQIEYFSSQFGSVSSDWKSDGSRVTEADIHLSHVFEDALGEGFPRDQFLSEELDHGDKPIRVTSEYSWLLDPIDGTNNFARRIPTCSISLGLLRHGNPVYGFIYDHASGRTIHGGPGKGIFVDDVAFEKPESEVTGQSLISIQSLADESAMRDENKLQMRFKLRAFGSSAIHMAYAALGWTDGVMAHRVKSWDIAAGVALMAATGGSTRFFDTEVFPVVSFSSKAEGFAHIAGSNAMCDVLEKTLDKSCKYRV